MARKSKRDELFEALRARGLRKSVARRLADATGRAGRSTPKGVKKVAADLRSMASDLEDRATGGPAKRKAAAKKAATRASATLRSGAPRPRRARRRGRSLGLRALGARSWLRSGPVGCRYALDG